jgi:hypothetical protein
MASCQSSVRLDLILGGDNRSTLLSALLSVDPDLARGSEVFCWVSYRSARSAQLAIADSRVAAENQKSFGQSLGLPRATLGLKATPLAEIVTQVSESYGTANGHLDQARAMLPATSAIFYTPLKRELIGRLWRFRINP